MGKQANGQVLHASMLLLFYPLCNVQCLLIDPSNRATTEPGIDTLFAELLARQFFNTLVYAQALTPITVTNWHVCEFSKQSYISSSVHLFARSFVRPFAPPSVHSTRACHGCQSSSPVVCPHPAACSMACTIVRSDGCKILPWF